MNATCSTNIYCTLDGYEDDEVAVASADDFTKQTMTMRELTFFFANGCSFRLQKMKSFWNLLVAFRWMEFNGTQRYTIALIWMRLWMFVKLPNNFMWIAFSELSFHTLCLHAYRTHRTHYTVFVAVCQYQSMPTNNGWRKEAKYAMVVVFILAMFLFLV